VTLILVDADGTPLGALPPLELEQPWWQEAGDVVAAARARFGLDVQVLRLLEAELPHPPGGYLTVLAQVEQGPEVALTPYEVDLTPHPLRAPWAVPGGPAASVAWARTAAGRDDLVASQQRSWNLSGIWRLDAGGAPVAWLKQVPLMFAHEPAVLRLVGAFAPGRVPTLLATGDLGRSLLAHISGEDRYEAGAEFCAEVARDFHPIQVHFAGRIADLLAAGVPDRRREADHMVRVAEPFLESIDGLAGLIDELPARLAAIEACGLPDTLVHGDLHPGNVRADGDTRVIVDWGDSSVAHPAYDILRLTGALPPQDAERLIAEWAQQWRAVVPGSDPARAATLIAPIAELRAAVTYAGFLDHMEPTEHPYHRDDVPAGLAAAVRLRA
jgi:phosphotransferase family enzyme